MNKMIGCALLVSILTGCQTHNLSIAYTPCSAVVKGPSADMLLVELPSDNRPLGSKSEVWGGMLVLIPLVPYGHNIAAPEFYMRARYKFAYSFTKDLQDVIVKDIKASGLVREVRAGERQLKDSRVVYDYAETGTIAPVFTWAGKTGPVPKGCKVLSIRLDEGVMDSYVTAYGLSAAVFPFWLFGAPIAYSDFNLTFTVQLKDDKGRVLAEQSFTGKETYCEFLYNNGVGIRAMPTAYGKTSGQLRRFLKANL